MKQAEVTIAFGVASNGNPRWMAYMKGKRGRLSPLFLKYESLIKWLRNNEFM